MIAVGTVARGIGPQFAWGIAHVQMGGEQWSHMSVCGQTVRSADQGEIENMQHDQPNDEGTTTSRLARRRYREIPGRPLDRRVVLKATAAMSAIAAAGGIGPVRPSATVSRAPRRAVARAQIDSLRPNRVMPSRPLRSRTTSHSRPITPSLRLAPTGHRMSATGR